MHSYINKIIVSMYRRIMQKFTNNFMLINNPIKKMCPKNVRNMSRKNCTNSGHFHCPENVQDMFQILIVSGHSDFVRDLSRISSCPEFVTKDDWQNDHHHTIPSTPNLSYK